MGAQKREKQIHRDLGDWVQQPHHPLPPSSSLPVTPSLQFSPLSSIHQWRPQPRLWGCLTSLISSLRPSLASASSRKPCWLPCRQLLRLCQRWPKPERGGGSQCPGLDRLQTGTSVPQRAPLPVAAQTLLLLADSFQTPWLRASPAHPRRPHRLPAPPSPVLLDRLPPGQLPAISSPAQPPTPTPAHQNSFCALEESEPRHQTHRTQVLTAGDGLCAWG